MSPRILVADDDALLVTTLTDILEGAGWSVLACHDGREAVATARREELHAVLLDARMAGGGGLAALPEIKRLRPGARVLMMSGYAPPELLDEAERLRLLRVLPDRDDVEDAAREIAEAAGTRWPALLLDGDGDRLDETQGLVARDGISVRRVHDVTEAFPLLGSGEPGIVTLPLSLGAIAESAALCLLLDAIPSVLFAFSRPAQDFHAATVHPPSGRARFLSKPFQPESLLSILAGWVGHVRGDDGTTPLRRRSAHARNHLRHRHRNAGPSRPPMCSSSERRPVQTDPPRTDTELEDGPDAAPSDPDPAAEATTGATPGSAEPSADLTDRVQQGLERLGYEFLELELEQMRKGEIEARAKLADAKKAVEARRAEVKDRLDTVRKASGSVLQEARGGLEAAWKELRHAVERARDDFEGRLEEQKGEGEEKRT